MPCPIMEANKTEKYCISNAQLEIPDFDPCEVCTCKLMDERLGDFYSTLVDEAWERHKDDEACKHFLGI